MKARKKKEYKRKFDKLMRFEEEIVPVGAKVKILQELHFQEGCKDKVGYIENIETRRYSPNGKLYFTYWIKIEGRLTFAYERREFEVIRKR